MTMTNTLLEDAAATSPGPSVQIDVTGDANTAFRQAMGESLSEGGPSIDINMGGGPDPASPSFPAQPAEDLSFADYALDIAKAVPGGIANAVYETADLAGEVGKLVTGNAGGPEVSSKNALREAGLDFLVPEERSTTAGRVVEGITTFITGFMAGGAALKGAKLLQGAGKMTVAGRGLAQSAISSFATFDGHEKNFANMVQDTNNEFFKGTVVEWLSVKEDDPELWGRTKNMLADFVVGAPLEALGMYMKGLKKAHTAKSEAEKMRIMDDTLEEISTKEASGELEKLGQERYTDFPSLAQAEKDRAHKPAVGFEERPDAGFMDSFGKATAEAPSLNVRQPLPFEKAPDKVLSPINGPIREAEAKYTPDATLLHDELTAVVNKSVNMEDLMRRLAEDWNFSTHVMQSEDGYKLIMQAQDLMRDKLLKGKGPEAHAEVVEKSIASLKRYGMDKVQDYLGKIADGSISLKEAAYAIPMLKDSLDFLTTQSLRYARKAEFNPASMSPQDVLDYIFIKKNIDAVYEAERNLATMSGRLTSAHKIKGGGFSERQLFEWYTAPRNLTAEEAGTLIAREGWTPDMLKKSMKDTMSNQADPAAMSKALRETRPGSKWGVLNEFRINNMLSGPITIGVNTMTNALKTMLMPAEKYLANVITGDDRGKQEAIDIGMGLFRHFSESFRLSKKAWKLEDSILDRGANKLEGNSAQMTYDNLRNIFLKDKPAGTELADWQELVARSVSFMGPYLRTPSRLLLSTDEFFKQLNYRATLDASLRREAMENGFTKADDIMRYVDEQMQLAFTPKGEALKGKYVDDVTKGHLLYAQQATWTQALGRDTLMGGMQTYVNEHPSLRLIVPFIKTPANLMRDFVAHTPVIGNLSRECRKALAAGGEEAALAKAKLATGTVMWFGVMTLAASGTLTGTPPSDPKMREALERTGWQPYSVKVGDKYYAYRRLDPLGMMLGIAADVAVMGQHLTQDKYEDVVKMLPVSLLNNVVSKTYMQGISEFVDLVNEPEEKWTQYMGRMGSTFIPLSSGLRFGRQMVDEPMREMRNFSDYMLNTIPGWSDTLPARRNWVDGSTINYALIGQNKNDMVFDELDRLAGAVPAKPEKTLHGIELSGEQYSRLNELHGTLRIGGKTMHESLSALFNSTDYDRSRSVLGDPPDKESGPRAVATRRVISAYRKLAQDTLIDENSELAMQVRQHDFQRQASKRGAMTGDNQQSLLESLTSF